MRAMERKSAADAFARKTPWPGVREMQQPSRRRLFLSALLALATSTYWAISILDSSGWGLAGNIAAASGGTFLAAYYVREWVRSRNDVLVSW